LILPLVQQSVEFTYPSPLASLEKKHRVKRRLLEWIDGARSSLLVAAYGLDDRDIIQALIRAEHRGVQVRTILSPEKDYPELEDTDLTLEVRNASGLQHVKAVLIDNRRFVSGTGNLTKSGLFFNNNAFLFLRVHRSIGERLRKKLLHPDEKEPFIRMPGITMVFSPEGGRLIQTILARKIYHARRSIRFLMFRFTDPTLSALLYYRARSGLPVQGILDGQGASLPSRSALEENYYSAGPMPLALAFDGNESRYQSADGIYHGGHLHHKTAIIDDQVLTGSYNWSMSARDQNREILFIMNRPEIQQRFHNRFEELKRISTALARPPYGTNLELEPAPEEEICLPEGANLFAVTGDDPFFHALKWQAARDTASEDCPAGTFPARSSRHSAGASKGKDYFIRNLNQKILLPDGQSYDRYQEPDALPTEMSGDLPCTAKPCRPLRLKRIDPEDGWLRKTESEHRSAPTEFFALARQRWLHRDLRRTAPGFYRFDPLPDQDMLLFFRNNAGETQIGCMYAGSMDPEIRRYLQFLRFHRTFADCIPAEGSVAP
tara:strand:- start:125 stop:1768 length:1644 start_codon:yes stop_codon:yes gene_type:complete